jgi:hypothetical protein
VCTGHIGRSNAYRPNPQKVSLRREVRIEFPELVGSDNNFIFDTKWQSTDVSASTATSAQEDAIKNAAAAAEDEAADGSTRHKYYKKRKKSNVWTTRTPNFLLATGVLAPCSYIHTA